MASREMGPEDTGGKEALQPFRSLIDERFESIEEVYAHRSEPMSVCRLLQRFPDRTDLAGSCDHTLNVSMGGCYAVEKYEGGRLVGAVERPDAVTLIPAHQESSWRACGLVDVVHFYIDPSSIDRFIEEETQNRLTPDPVCAVLGQSDPFLRGLAALIGNEVARGSFEDRMFSESLAQLVVSHVARTYTRGGRHCQRRGRGARSPSASKQVARARDFILEHLCGHCSLEEVAAHAGLSPWRLRQVFRRELGETPYQFVLSCRVARAQELLADGSTALAEVAYACGFASQSHMTDVFRNKLGVTPGRYRREVRGRTLFDG